MIVIWGVILGVIVGRVRGGTLENLGTVRFRALWLVFAALGLQFLIFPVPWWSVSSIFEASAVPHLVSYALVGAFLILNRWIPSIWTIAVGSLLNLSVILANGGYMPTDTAILAKSGNPEVAAVLSGAPGTAVGNVIAMDESTRLNLLGDRFFLPHWIPFGDSFSIGDFVLATGILLLIVRGMVQSAKGRDSHEAAQNMPEP